MENLTEEQRENAITQIRQGKEVNKQNQNPQMKQPQKNRICQQKGKNLMEKQRE